MRFQTTFRLTLIFALVVSAAAFLAARGFLGTRDSAVPIVFRVSPPHPTTSAQVSITVELDYPASTDQVVTIGCTDAQAFTDLPPSVVVPAGESSCTFGATTSNVFTNWAVLAATANGGTALAVTFP